MNTAPAELTVASWHQLERIRSAVATAVVTLWELHGHTPPLNETVELVLAGQAAIVASTDAFLSAAAGIATTTDTSPIGIEADPLIGRAARHGTPLETVYSRPSKVLAEAGADRAKQYLESTVYMDMQLAQRQAATAHVQSDQRVIGWRRQINPVGGGKTCGLCVAAACRLYRKRDLLALHRMCRCTVYEVYTSDPIRNTNYIDRERLAEVYKRTGGDTSRSATGRIRFAPEDLPPGVDTDAIRTLRPRVVNDPELGPVLTGARHDSVIDL